MPDASVNEIIGLLELLDAHQGERDIFHLAIEIHKEFGHLINIAKAAELLDFVDTPKQKILLTELGKDLWNPIPKTGSVSGKSSCIN